MKKTGMLLAIFIFLLPCTVLAPMAISMMPPKMEFYLKPKKKVREVIELENRGFKPTRLKVYVTGFSIQEKGNLNFSRKDYTAEKWIKINPNELEIKPYDYGLVRYEIRVPEGTSAGSYTACIMIEEVIEPKRGEKRAQFIIKGRLAHIIYVNVGKPNYQGKIEWLKVKKKKGKLIFSFGLKNEGNFYFRTEGRLKIEGEKGVREIPIPNLPVLRQTSRIIEVTIPKGLPLGKYRALLSLDIGAKTPLKAETEFAITESN